MKIRKYIELGEERAGKQAELAKILGIRDSYLRQAKLGKSGLPDAVCIELADYIGVDRLEVIAASNLVTEKDEKRRKIFESCFTNASRAASIGALAFVISILTAPHNQMINKVENQANLQKYKLCAIDHRKTFRKKSEFLVGMNI